MKEKPPLLSRLDLMHAFSIRHGLYPMFLSSMLCVGLLAGRFYISRVWTYYFLLWNLFLAWLPYIGSVFAYTLHIAEPKRWLRIIPVVLASILFFPNAPYIVTDFLHLRPRSPVPFWYDMGMLAAFSWAGILLGVYALRLMHCIVEDWLGKWTGWFFVMCVVILSGFGIYMGRFLRWNSWDIILNPRVLLLDIAVRVRYPLDHLQAYGVALLFAALLLSCYIALAGFPALKPGLPNPTRQNEVT